MSVEGKPVAKEYIAFEAADGEFSLNKNASSKMYNKVSARIQFIGDGVAATDDLAYFSNLTPITVDGNEVGEIVADRAHIYLATAQQIKKARFKGIAAGTHAIVVHYFK